MTECSAVVVCFCCLWQFCSPEQVNEGQKLLWHSLHMLLKQRFAEVQSIQLPDTGQDSMDPVALNSQCSALLLSTIPWQTPFSYEWLCYHSYLQTSVPPSSFFFKLLFQIVQNCVLLLHILSLCHVSSWLYSLELWPAVSLVDWILKSLVAPATSLVACAQLLRWQDWWETVESASVVSFGMSFWWCLPMQRPEQESQLCNSLALIQPQTPAAVLHFR